MKKWKIADTSYAMKKSHISEKPELNILIDILSKLVAFNILIGSLIKCIQIS